jgi:two-component system response regulator ChvI
MIQKLLLVDDDAALCRILSEALGEEGFAVTVARTGAEGLRCFEASPPDLAILDVLLPEMDGLELCRRLRRRHTTPIILLTSRAEEVDRVTGLDLGADDYITKPFSTRELCARIRAIDRRLSRSMSVASTAGAERGDKDRRGDGTSPRSAVVEPPLAIGELVIDRARFSVLWKGQPVALTRSEFQVLHALVHNRGLVLTRDQLLDLARGSEVVVTDRTVDTFIRRIRKKIAETDAGFDGIETVFGVGYRYRA